MRCFVPIAIEKRDRMDYTESKRLHFEKEKDFGYDYIKI